MRKRPKKNRKFSKLPEPPSKDKKDKTLKFIKKAKVGDKNLSGSEIIRIFHRSIGNYIIYQTVNTTLVSATYNPNKQYNQNLIKFETEISLLKSLLIDKTEKERFMPRIAGAYKSCFENRNKEAKKVFKSIIESVKNYKLKIGRLWYFFGTILITLVIFIAHIICYLLCEKPNDTIIDNIIYSMMFGGIGAAFSVSTYLNKISYDIEINTRSDLVILGATRGLIGIISGLTTFFIIKSELIFAKTITEIENSSEMKYNSIVYLFSMISGFSEKFIPSLIDKIEVKYRGAEK